MVLNVKCVVPENIHNPCTEGIRNAREVGGGGGGGGGVMKLTGISGGGEVIGQIPSVGEGGMEPYNKPFTCFCAFN